MYAEDLLLDDGGERKTVEDVHERLPDLDGVAPLALVVEAVDSANRRALVVAAEHEEVLGELDLVAEEEEGDLERVLSAVDVVT